MKKFRVIDLRSLWLIKVIFHKAAAFYFLGDKDWENYGGHFKHHHASLIRADKRSSRSEKDLEQCFSMESR